VADRRAVERCHRGLEAAGPVAAQLLDGDPERRCGASRGPQCRLVPAAEDIRKAGWRDPDETREISLAEVMHPNQVSEVPTSLATEHLGVVRRRGLHMPSLPGIPTLSTEKMEIVLTYRILYKSAVSL
jgi:hypothetical protein